MKRLLPILFPLLLSACQNFYTDDTASPFYRVPTGSQLTLTRPLTIPPYELKTYIQGDIVAQGARRLSPYCVLELRNQKSVPQTVQPDTFTITRVGRTIDHFAGIDQPDRLYAALIISDSHGEGPGLVTYATRMDVRSVQQPDVLSLTCAILQDYTLSSQHLSIAQMRAALGSYFRLDPAG